ncbi:hypothetical protein J437_LFUL017019 [Ladona fulva]|uniref:Rho GTPase-activating protein 44 n=1 Tax=Ladona fulva TaxID=123851 RepID=A0A8K0KQP5_LADFU|nr:hypothetical protein J437_LFUL017019 [Ladona fulva]
MQRKLFECVLLEDLTQYFKHNSLTMKKQFFRVKQLADQTFSRAGKTEVLSDDLQGADKRVEFIRNACQNTTKKLSATLLGQGIDATAKEKRLKKSPGYMIGHAMLDSSVCEENYLLKSILGFCGQVETQLAQEEVDYDLRVEQEVLNPIMQILETEVPNILKHKRNLAKLILDMDSARTRHQTALKHSGNTAGGTAKVDSIKEELEDAELKVEQCRDMLATEMFALISKEAHLSNLIVEFAKIQRAYHENALNILGKVLPDLENCIRDSSVKPVYGQALEEHLRVTGRKIAYPIELCVCALLELGMEEEGLFRVAGGASKVRRMKMSFDASCLSYQTALEYHDPHVIAGALKSYLRELPEPLFTHLLYDEWMAAARTQGSNDERLHALWQVLHRLPQANFDNVKYLIKFLAALSRNQEVNKMNPQNIAIVIAPNLIWSQTDEGCGAMGMNMNTANLHSFIVDHLVSYADWFFPGELDFYQTIIRSVPEGNGATNGSDISARVGAISMNGLNSSQSSSGSDNQHRKGHTRSSSGSGDGLHNSSATESTLKRTQSGSSLSDHGSPPHGSPKPVIRRKNKPAPVPPVEKPEKPPRPAPLANALNDVSQKKHPDAAPLARSEDDEEDDDDGGFKGRSVPLTQAIRTPVAAPRTIVPAKEVHEDNADVSSVEIERPKPAVPERPAALRQGSFRVSASMAIPQGETERDVPNSESSIKPMLERAHMYSVDKQQVSIIQVGGEKTVVVPSPTPPLHNAPSAPEQEHLKGPKRKDPVPSEKPERPPKPENLGHMSTLERRRPSASSHNRTMSDGNIAERENIRPEAEKQASGKRPVSVQPVPSPAFSSPPANATVVHNSGTQSCHPSGVGNPPVHSAVQAAVAASSLPPSSPRVVHPHRPPRPTPPPPPPPTSNPNPCTQQLDHLKPRASSVSESTDL